jgi:hypothetical protein
LVTKPYVDISKAIQQEKVVNNTNSSIIQQVKMDNFETQCDKENNSNEISTSIDTLTPSSTSCNATGYDSDSSKPVKVKSRWRRSSELEMGGSIAPPPERNAPVNIGESTSSESKYNVISTNI